MIRLTRSDATHPDFIALVKLLDADLACRDGADHTYYNQFNKIDGLKHVLIAYVQDIPVGCGALKVFDRGTMEVKRMYIQPEHRGKGIATALLTELEIWAASLGCSRCVLETGKKQPEAMALYHKSGYKVIPNYGQYIGIENSVCFEKIIR